MTAVVSRIHQQALSIAQAALEKKASDVLILEVEELTSVADYFIVASGESERQVKAIANHISREISTRYHTTPLIEGAGTANWILLDYGDIVVHVFKSDIRQYYGLEKMWSDAPRVPLPERNQAGVNTPAFQPAQPSTPLVAQYGS